ncbi:hypothetical protein [Lacisediminihabitans sp. H27-G8]
MSSPNPLSATTGRISGTTASSGSKGFGGGDRIQATLVFEKLS